MSVALTSQQFDVEKTVSGFVTNIKAGIEMYVKNNMGKMTMDIAKRFFLFYYYFDDLAYKLAKNDQNDQNDQNLVTNFTNLFNEQQNIDNNILQQHCTAIQIYFETNQNIIKECINHCIDNVLNESENSIKKCFENDVAFKATIKIVQEVIQKFTELKKYKLLSQNLSKEDYDVLI
jgi:hypothetical protein